MPRTPAPRRASLVSWPLYRLLMLIALLPVLIAALAVREPALPPEPADPLPAFDGTAAANLAASFRSGPADREPGGAGDRAAAARVARGLRQNGFAVQRQDFAADLPGRPNVPMQNVIGYLPGHRADAIAIIAHHDGVGTGTDDNDAALGLMLQLAAQLQPLTHQRGLMLVSTDGGTTGGQGAAYFASHSPLARKVSAAIVLDSVAAQPGTPPKILIRPDSPRGTSPTLFRTARSALALAQGESPDTPGLLDQLSGLAVPYALNEQGPLLARGVPSVTLTAGPPPQASAPVTTLSPAQLGQLGTAVARLAAQLDGAASIEPGGRPDLFLGSRTVRGWLAQTALVALFAPALACILDLAARCRRRRIALAPGVRALAWRWACWAALVVALWIEPALPGSIASAIDIAPRPEAIGLGWTGILLAVLAAIAVWRFAARPRIRPLRPVSGADRTGGLAAALLGVAFSGTLLVAINPFALVLLLPAAHAWLAIPAAARHGRRAMLTALLLGGAGAVLLVWEFAFRFHLGMTAPRALLAMVASGYWEPAVVACLTVAAASGTQLAAIVAGRYGPAHGPDRLYN